MHMRVDQNCCNILMKLVGLAGRYLDFSCFVGVHVDQAFLLLLVVLVGIWQPSENRCLYPTATDCSDISGHV